MLYLIVIFAIVYLLLDKTNIKEKIWEVKMRQKKKHIFKKRQKRLNRKKGQNAGQFFEDILYKDLKSRMWKGKRFYNGVAENVKYKDEFGIEREVDDFAIHHREGHKRYIVIVECKLSDRRSKATKQLTITKHHIQNEFPKARIFCIYAWGYKKRTSSYHVEWLRGI